MGTNIHHLLAAIVTIIAVSVSTYALIYSANFDPNTNKTIMAVVFSICTIITVDNLYRKIFITLLMGRDLTKAFTIQSGQHRSVWDVLRGSPPPVSPTLEERRAASIQCTDGLKYDPTDLTSISHRKKQIHGEISALQAELAEIMQREFCTPSSQDVSSSGHVASMTSDNGYHEAEH